MKIETVLLIIIGIPYLISTIIIIYYARKYDISRFMKEINELPKITIVLPTYNEENVISKKLDNVLNLDYPYDKLEIIVVDCSTDNTPTIVQEYIKNYPFIKLIRESERRGLATALNIGYKEATGSIVIKSDTDSLILSKNALKRVAKLFANPKIGGVCGIRTGGDDTEGGLRSLQILQQMAETMIDSTIIAHGSFAAFRRRLIEPINPRSFADDTELFIKIRKKGYKTLLDTSIETFEPYETNPKKRLKQMSRRAGGIIKVIIENFTIFLNFKYGKFGFIIYPLNFLMLIFLPWATLILLLLFAFMLYCLIGTFFFCLGILITLLVVMASYCTGKPKIIAGLMDIILSSLIGQLKLCFKRIEYKWEKVRPNSHIYCASSNHVLDFHLSL